MASKLYVGGLPYTVKDPELSAMFTPYGTVESARVITDRTTGQSRGFGFVEMSNAEEAKSAIAGLDGTELEGRKLIVNVARPPQENRPTSYGGGGRGKRNY
jgi:RNA recognition motif-containing protein